MKKLTLKEIAGYLPYNLQILCNSEEEIYISTMVGLHSNGIDDDFGNNWDLEVKPLLYPLEMLTQDIELKIDGELYGEKINVIDFLNIAKSETYTYHKKLNAIRLSFFGKGYKQWNFNVNGQLELPYRVIQLLYENHFDIHNLIPRSLAIDKSTLNSK